MKKLFFLSMLIAASITVTAQSTYSAYKSQMGRWNTYTKEWEWEASVTCNLTFTFYAKKIFVNDKANSEYTVYEDEGETTSYNNDGDKYTQHTWRCYDERNRNVFFSITNYINLGINVCSVMYNDVCYKYYMRKSNLSNF